MEQPFPETMLRAHGTEGDLWEALLGLGLNILVYLSFMTLGIFWVGQGTQLSPVSYTHLTLPTICSV